MLETEAKLPDALVLKLPIQFPSNSIFLLKFLKETFVLSGQGSRSGSVGHLQSSFLLQQMGTNSESRSQEI